MQQTSRPIITQIDIADPSLRIHKHGGDIAPPKSVVNIHNINSTVTGDGGPSVMVQVGDTDSHDGVSVVRVPGNKSQESMVYSQVGAGEGDDAVSSIPGWSKVNSYHFSKNAPGLFWATNAEDDNTYPDLRRISLSDLPDVVSGDPYAPTNVTLTITTVDSDKPDSFMLNGAWSAPTYTTGTVGYEWAAFYWMDAGGTVPETGLSDWITLGRLDGVASTAASNGPHSRQPESRWARIRVRSVSATGYSAWVQSALALVAGARIYQLPESGITGVTLDVGGDSRLYELAVGWTPPSPRTNVAAYEFQVRFWLDSGGVTPDSDWLSLSPIYDKDLTATIFGPYDKRDIDTWAQVRMRSVSGLNRQASTYVYSTGYDKVDKIAAPPAVNGIVLTIEPGTVTGVPAYRVKADVTPAAAIDTTKEYIFEVAIFTDAGGTIPIDGPAGQWRPFGAAGAETTAFTAYSDWWLRDTVTRYARVRIYAKNENGDIGAYVVSGVGTITASSGLNLSVVDGTTIHSDLLVSGGKLTVAAVNLLSAYGFNTDEFTVSGGSFAVDQIVVNKLAAGTAVFTGTVTFSYSSSSVVIDSNQVSLNGTNIYINGSLVCSSGGSFGGAVAFSGGMSVPVGQTANISGTALLQGPVTFTGSTFSFSDAGAFRTALGVAYGSSAGTVCEGNDSRLSNARTPTAHASTHATAGSDPIAPGDIGAATSGHNHTGVYSPVGHTHTAGDITNFTVAVESIAYNESEVNGLLATKADAASITPGTATLLKLTGGGTDGSITVNAQGIVTNLTPPT